MYCTVSDLKVPSGQIGSTWEWYHWIGIEKNINRYRFIIFYLSLKYFKRLQSSEPLHAKINPTSCLFGSFLPIGWLTFIWWKSTALQYLGLDCGMLKFFTLKPQSKEQLMSLPRFEHMQTVIRTSRRIRGLFAWSGSELGSCFKYSALKLSSVLRAEIHCSSSN